MRVPYEVWFKPEHLDTPLLPTSADELIDAVDEMATSEDICLKYMYVLPREPNTSALFVGVSGTQGVGSLYYASPVEARYSKGDRCCGQPVCYLDFGNPRYFPSDSMVPLEILKSAVGSFYDTRGKRPDVIEWQEWSDEGADETDRSCLDPWGE
ncbi:Imm1 family immunity protein [Nocardia sp. NPDC004415]